MRVKLICLIFLLAITISCNSDKYKKNEAPYFYTSKVDPFIGTDGKAKTYPGATVPFGMIQLSPDNGRNGWDWISGYFYPDTIISGFSHLHLSGTGAGDLYDISFLPTSGSIREGQLDEINPAKTVHSRFSHDQEQASPGYYQVYLDDYNVNVELTASERMGMQRYTYENEDAQVRLHLGYTRNWDAITESYIKVINDHTIVGCRKSTGWAKEQHVYFVSEFSSPFTYQLSDGENLSKADSLNGKNILAVFKFDSKEVLIKTSISSVSTQNAIKNLKAEKDGFDFESVRASATDKWEEKLSQVEILADEDNMTQFYTAMYHSMLAPTLFSDVDGRYKGTNGEIMNAGKHPRYSTYSLWDTYRALHPWLTIAAPEKVEELIYSMLRFYDESGKLPVWNMQGNETNMMIGYHAVPVLTDALNKGIAIDTQLAYAAMKESAMQDDFALDSYKKYCYIP